MRTRYQLTDRVALVFDNYTGIRDCDYTVTIITDEGSVVLTDRDWMELDIRIKRVRGLAVSYGC